MQMVGELKPIAPFFVGQVVGFVDKPAPLANYCSVGNWYAVATEPKHESLAMGEIAGYGIVTYLPIMAREEPHGRGSKRLCEKPMFPSYLFVCCFLDDGQYGRIANARGVRRFIGIEGKPLVIPDGHIEVVRLKETEHVEQEGARLAALYGTQSTKSGIVWHFSPGDRVRIKKGPFAAFSAELETAVDSHDRVSALVNVFGRLVPTELSAFDVEKL